MSQRLYRDLRGGAVVELAISMVVIVPLILYSTWFADVAHWKLKLEEASIVSAMDLTAFKVNDHSRLNPSFGQYYAHATSQAAHGAGSIYDAMRTSFDSGKPNAYTFQSSVFVEPHNLDVKCTAFPNGDPGPRARSFNADESRVGQHVPELNTHSWVTCSSEALLQTAGMPRNYREMASDTSLVPAGWSQLKLCGVGPGVQGCGGRSAGLSVMLDDWGLWNPATHEDDDMPLSLGNWPQAAPNAAPSVWDGQRNNDYFKLAKRYWRSPQEWSGVAVMADGMSAAGAKEMGETDWFHLSYRYGAAHAYDDQETLYGQKGAYGGPDGTQRPDPHTGGPWHEQAAEPSGGGAWGVSRHSWTDRSNTSFMGVKNWPVDRQ